MDIIILLSIIALVSSTGWRSEYNRAERNYRKMVALMEHLDAEGRGQEAIELVKRA